MATATPNKPTAPSTTKRLHGGSSTPPPSITRVATARSAASPRVASSLNSSLARRHSSKVAPPSTIINGESPESLSISLKQETDQKEQACFLCIFLEYICLTETKIASCPITKQGTDNINFDYRK